MSLSSFDGLHKANMDKNADRHNDRRGGDNNSQRGPNH